MERKNLTADVAEDYQGERVYREDDWVGDDDPEDDYGNFYGEDFEP